MENFSLFLLIAIFLGAGAITWFAGVVLAKTTDTLDTRYKLGDALGGMILLGITGSLPEITIAITAAIHGNVSIVTGSILGSIAIKTLVIAIFDFASKKKPLSFLASSPIIIIETIFALTISLVALLGTAIAPAKSISNISPFSLLIGAIWIAGLYIVLRSRKNHKLYETANDEDPGRKHSERRASENHPFYAKKTNLFVIGMFLLAGIATLIAGVLLEETGVLVAQSIGMSSGLFAATIIALVCTLPEISAGVESVIIGDYQLAISDIMGGISFLMVAFIICDIIMKKPVLSFAGNSDVVLASAGVVMVTIYTTSFLLRLKKQFFRLGADSILQVIVYLVAVYLSTKI